MNFKTFYSIGALGTGLYCTHDFACAWGYHNRWAYKRTSADKFKDIAIAIPIILTVSALWPITAPLFAMGEESS